MASEFDFSARRAELVEELEAIVSQLPALRTAAAAAKDAAEVAQYRFDNFVKRFRAATRHGQDLVSPALVELLEDERRSLRAATGAAVKAAKAVENAEWSASCRRDDIAQIDLLMNPPPLQHKFEVVKRAGPQVPEDYDSIVMPSAARAA